MFGRWRGQQSDGSCPVGTPRPVLRLSHTSSRSNSGGHRRPSCKIPHRQRLGGKLRPYGLSDCPTGGTLWAPARPGREFHRESITFASCDPNGKTCGNTMGFLCGASVGTVSRGISGSPATRVPPPTILCPNGGEQDQDEAPDQPRRQGSTPPATAAVRAVSGS